jgi:leucyl aminopeptidase
MVPLAENNISNNPTRPGDIITAYNGKTVEIIDTDAEGRLLLADCLAYANNKYPNAKIIDFATLTGDQHYFSCKMFSNVFTRHKELEEHIIDSGNYIQEQIVALPYIEKFKKFIESESADLRNVSVPDCGSGMITSAVFLGQFIDENVEWAHIDMAGPAWKNESEYMPGDASAIGVRLLYEIID